MCKKSYYLEIYKDVHKLSYDIIHRYGKTNKKYEKPFQYTRS